MKLFKLFTLLSFSLFFTQINAQQLGADIDGELPGDQSGYAVALSSDGSTVAIGARFNDGNGPGAGHVRVYDWDGSDWAQKGADIDGEASGDASGRSVSISSDGNRVAIGATGNSGNGAGAGHVRVYEWNGANWMQLGNDIDGEALDDGSGYSVSLSSDGSRVAIGARDNDDNGLDAGHARVYEWNGANWMQLGNDIDGEAPDDSFGYAVFLSSDGNTLAVGARDNDGNGSGAGHVRVYDWDGTDWIQVGTDLDGDAADDQFGVSVALSADNNRLAVGARFNDESGMDAGQVKIFDRDGNNWTQVGMTILGEAAGDRFGRSVSLSANGNRLAIGARYNDDSGIDAGHVRVYDWDGVDWMQAGADIDGEAGGDLFGGSISISSDGSTLAVGAHLNNSGTGHVRVFDLGPITHVESVRTEDIKLFPNPTRSYLFFEGIDMQDGTIVLSDVYGKEIRSFKVIDSKIDLSTLSKGVYFVTFNFSDHSIVKKVLKI